MRIALDFQSAKHQKTGIGLYSSELLPALRRVAPEHEFIPLDWGQNPAMHLDRRLLWQQVELPRRTRKAKANLLHVTGFDAPRIKPCPVVLTVHDLIGMLFPAQFPPASRLYWARWLPRTVRWANAVIADSEATRADLLRLLKIPPERVAVIPLGVRESFKAPILPEEIQRVRHSYNLPEQYLLYTGTIEPRKGLETLIEALCSLVDTFPHYLLIAGKRGWYSNEILSSVVRCGLERRVRLMGYVPDEDLPALYAGADVFVFPSKYEGFGLPPLEAMACGAPVVASNASSLPEVIGDAGILTPPEDAEALAEAIRRVLESTELQEDLRQRGKLRAAQFSWDETARRTLKVYEQVARKGKWIQENQDDRHD